jgi:hypothetical protein
VLLQGGNGVLAGHLHGPAKQPNGRAERSGGGGGVSACGPGGGG